MDRDKECRTSDVGSGRGGGGGGDGGGEEVEGMNVVGKTVSKAAKNVLNGGGGG